MVTLLELLRDGYFPRELPPPFTTAPFANLIFSNVASLPACLETKFKSNTSDHNITRVGTLRRKLGIPNPIAQYQLSKEIATNWNTLDTHIQNSKISVSKPVAIKDSGRALAPQIRPRLLPILRASRRLGAKYLLKSDISNFYHSIYTHSIPWALHGKSLSKQNRSPMLLGNKLDILTRSTQDDQTVGIPIGPDTSFLLSEILLASVDQVIINNLGGTPCGFRWADDFELCFSNILEAEVALNTIESALSDFELILNPRKTIIEQLPLSLDDYWAIELKYFNFRTTETRQQNDLINYFSRAFDLAKANPESSVLRYAVARLRSEQIFQSNWPLFQDLMLQCVNSEPGTLPNVLEHYVRFSQIGYPVDIDKLEQILNYQIEYHSPLRHASEVAWSVWGAIAFQTRLHPKSAQSISKMDDSVVALLALDAEQRGLFQSPIDKTNWSQYMTQNALSQEQWLLSYEANVKGFMPSMGRGDHVNSNPSFRYLKANGVYFYDPTKAAKVIPNATLPFPGGDFYG